MSLRYIVFLFMLCNIAGWDSVRVAGWDTLFHRISSKMSGLHARKTSRGVQNHDLLLRAIRSTFEEDVSLRKASRIYKISRSSLQRYVEKVRKRFSNTKEVGDDELKNFLKDFALYRHPQVFNREQERALMEYIIKCSDIYFGLSRHELKKLAFDFAMKIGVEFPESWNEQRETGNTWFYGFMRRHPNLSMRQPEAISLARATAFNRENVMSFFTLFGSVRDKVANPGRIWNMDETGFTTVAKANRVVSRKGVKRISFLTSQERGSLVTMALAVSATGNKIPPFFVFPRTNYRQSYLDHASVGATGVANPSGWMNQDSFVKFIDHFIQHTNCSQANAVILLIDNHNSHLSIEALDKASESGIHIVSFPPHTSHKLQPLDVSVYAPLKSLFNAHCNYWMKDHAGRAMEIQHIPQVVATALGFLSEQTITAGFRATGIYPYNPDIFTEADYIASDLSAAFSVDEDQIDEEHDRTIAVDDQNVGANEEVFTLEPTASTSTASLADSLCEVGPVKPAGKKPRSNRGRKPMKSSVLTSVEMRQTLRDAANKAAEKSKAKQSAKGKPSPKSKQTAKQKQTAKPKQSPKPKQSQAKQRSSSSEEDFCTKCLKAMPRVCNKANSATCHNCGREFHKACATYRGGIFHCVHCLESDEMSSND